MKKKPLELWRWPRSINKVIRMMKLLLLLLFFFASAQAYTQKVNVTVKSETSLNEVLRQLKDQTGVRILYDAGKAKSVLCRQMVIRGMDVRDV